jgi:hypothetical protein
MRTIRSNFDEEFFAPSPATLDGLCKGTKFW